MKAIELKGTIDEKGMLKADTRLELVNKQVKIIVLYQEDEDIDESEWLRAMNSNPAFNFLSDPAEDIYTTSDGEPMKDEV